MLVLSLSSRGTYKYQPTYPWISTHRVIRELQALMFAKTFSILFSLVAAATGAVVQAASSVAIQTANNLTSQAPTTASSQASSTMSQAVASAALHWATAEVCSTVRRTV